MTERSQGPAAGSPDVSAPLQYLTAARTTMDRIGSTQLPVIEKAAELCARAIDAGGLVHLFGSGHSRIAVEEMYPRYGSFPGFHPIVELSLTNHHQVVGANGQRQAMFLENVEGLAPVILNNFHLDADRDVMIVVSAGGTNAVPVEVAAEARARGLPVIAITSVEHSRASRARVGRRLFEIADLTIDLCTPPGDAAVYVGDVDTPVGPLTSIASVCIINMIKVGVAERLAATGSLPPVLTSAVLVGEERSRELFESSYREYRERTRRL